MIRSRDIERSRGENKASEDDELGRAQLCMSTKCGEGDEIPHAYEVLHHELVESLRWVGHINLPWPISKISLRAGSFSCRRQDASRDIPSP